MHISTRLKLTMLAGLVSTALVVPVSHAAVMLAADGISRQILRFDLATGAALGAFTSGTNLNSPRDMTWGADGHLLVLDGNFSTFTYQVHRFHGSSGVFLSTLIEGGNPNASITVHRHEPAFFAHALLPRGQSLNS